MPLSSREGSGLAGSQQPAWALHWWAIRGGQKRVGPVGMGAVSRGPGSAPALLLARPGLCQAAMAWLSAARDGHAGWWGGVEGSSLISGGVWYPPAYLQTSPGGH